MRSMLLRAEDELLRDLTSRLSAALSAAGMVDAKACLAATTGSDFSGLLRVAPGPAELLLQAMEVAYLDGRSRSRAPTPSLAEVEPLIVDSLLGPDAFEPDELESLD